MGKHDSSYKLLFSHRKMVADLLSGFVHEDWAEGLDLSTLQRVREIGISHDLRENMQRVVGCLVDWLAGPEHASLRRAFVVWLKRVLLPARLPGIEIPELNELQEIHDMLAERVKTWTQEWKQQGLQEGEAKVLRRQLTRRFGPLPSWADQRLGQATEAELETWTDRVLDCLTLEDVFRGAA